jgi:hypothetical protein
MATFEEPIEEDIEFDSVDELAQETEAQEQVEEPEVETNPEPEIPDKYRGKSMAEIIKMHQESEKLIGRQAQEVGKARRLADELLQRELSQKQAVQTPQEEEKDPAESYLEDPVGAVNKAVDNHPAIQQAKQQAFEYKQQQVTQRLRNQFPNFDDVIQDSRFFEWVKASPIRTRLFTEAHSQYDYNSAVELISTWNAMNPVEQRQQSTQTPDVVTEAKKETARTLKTAAVDTGSPAPTSRKTYRRADLINLRLRDPARYDAMADEIMAAYAEGRVK